MKKILLIILSLSIMLTSFTSVPAFAIAAQDEQIETSTDSKEYFLPVIIEGDKVYQDGQEISSTEQNGEIMVAKDEIKGVDEALTDSAYVSIDDIAKEIGAEKIEDNSQTVYAKPFQTKTLIVDTQGKMPKTNYVEKHRNSDGSYLLEYESEAETKRAYEALENSNSVKSVCGENVYSISEVISDAYSASNNISWGADYVNSPQIVDFANSLSDNKEITVAIVDTGVQSHPDLNNRISSKGYNFVSNNNKPLDKEGHGTHCAGIVVDNTPDNVKIMPLKGLDDSGYGSDSELAKCINYAVENGADVISMSWGGYTVWTENVLKNAINKAYSAGVTLVAAAGNESEMATNYYPASSSYCITVGATDKNGRAASFSNYGTAVDLSAPGVAIRSTYLNGGYAVLSGTSMAAPFVAAAAATDFTINGKGSPGSEKTRIKQCVTPFTTQPKQYRGTGIIDFSPFVSVSFAKPVSFSVKSGFYENEFELELSCEEENARIYYEIQNSANQSSNLPSDKTSELYTSPIRISENTIITATAYCEGKYHSKYTQATYRFNNYDFDSAYEIDENGIINKYHGVLEYLAVPEYIYGIKVVGVGNEAFKNTVLKEVVFPNSVKSFAKEAFYNCRSLEKVICRGLRAISDRCFYYCTKLTKIEADSVQGIGESCFYYCTGFDENSINLDNVKLIPAKAFAHTNITNVEFPNVVSIGERAFDNCDNIVSVVLPNLEIIGEYAFNECNGLETIRLDNTQTIANRAFSNCQKLKTVHFENVRKMGYGVFYVCSALKVVNAPKLEETGGMCFINSGIESADFPLLTKIGDSEFSGCYRLKEVNLGNIEEIPKSAFRGCALEEIPDCLRNAKSVSLYAFHLCKNLKNIRFEKAEYVGDAFEGLTELETLELPSCRTVEGMKLNSEALKELNLPEAQEVSLELCSDCVIKELSLPKAKRVSLEGRCIERVNLPECVYFSGFYDYSNCLIKEFNAPNLCFITNFSFRDCTELEEINLINLKGINRDAFINCPKLKYAYLPQCEGKLDCLLNRGKALEYFYVPNISSIESGFSGGNSVEFFYAPKAKKVNIGISGVSSAGEVNLKSAISGNLNNETEGAENLNIHAPYIDETIELIKDLPAEFTQTNESCVISVSAKCSAPKYEWYYSENNHEYKKLSADRHNIVPDKTGYYYCIITDEKTSQRVESSVCLVSVQADLKKLTVNFGDYDCCIKCDKNYFENVKNGETLCFPKGSELTVFSDIPHSKIQIGEENINISNGGFCFELTDNCEAFSGLQKVISGNMVSVGNCKFNASGYNAPAIPEYSVKEGKKLLVEDRDYIISFDGNTYKNSSAEYIVRGIGEDTGLVLGSFAVEQYDISECRFAEIEDQMYTGYEIRPESCVYEGNTPMFSYINLVYSSNTMPGKAKITAKGVNGCNGYVYSSFNIYATSKMMNISLEEDSYKYTSKPIVPEFNVVLFGNILKAGEDYTVVCENNTEVGTAKATVILKEPYYKGSESFEYEIVPNENPHVHKYVILNHKAESHWYECYCCEKSTAHSHSFVVKEAKYANCIYKGKIVYQCSLCGESYAQELEALGHKPGNEVIRDKIPATYDSEGSFDIVVYCQVCDAELSRTTVKTEKLMKISIEKADVYGVNNKTYTGKAITQKLTVKYGQQTLKDYGGYLQDYKVSYKNSKNVGTATVTVSGVNAYSGKIEKTFKINPKGTSLSGVTAKSKGFTVKWKKQATQTTGYQIQYATDSKFTKNKKTVTVAKNSTVSKTVSKLRAKKKYFVRIRTYKTVSGKKYYSAWSSSKSVTTKK